MSTEVEDPIVEEVPETAPEVDAEQPEQAAAPEPEEVTITIGDEQPAQEEEQAPEWVRELRRKNREDQKRIRELEAKLQQTQPAAAMPRLGPKPTLEGHDYDSTKYEAALDQWYAHK